MPADLLTRLDTLPWSERGRLLATWGRHADVDRARTALAASADPWQRALAIVLAARRRDAHALLLALADPSLQVRRVACKHAVRHIPDDDALARAAHEADPDTRRRLLQHIARHRRQGVARALAPALLAAKAHRDLRVVVHLLDWAEIARILAVTGVESLPWKRLAQHHPDAVLDHVRAELAATDLPSEHQRIWTRYGTVLPALRRTRLDALLTLLEAHRPTQVGVLEPILGPLLATRPERTFALLLAMPDTAWPVRLGDCRRRHLRALSDHQLQRLAAHLADSELALAALLAALPPSRRETVFDAALAHRPDRLWGMPLLDQLPHEPRHAQARRHLALPETRSDPDGPATLAPWLPLDEATALLVPEGRPRQKDGDARARTWRRWLDTIARERKGLDAVLDAIGFLRNEQDPVRLSVIQGLAALPIGLYRIDHVAALDAFTTAILEARDTSWTTRHGLQTLAVRLLMAHAGHPDDPRFALALRMLEGMRAHGQALHLPRLDRGLRRGAEVAVCDAILGHLRNAAARERGYDVVALAASLGERAWAIDALQELLANVAFTDRDTFVRARAIEAWIEAPATRDERVTRILAHDASAATLAPVWTHLSTWRTDKLDPYLRGRPLAGRWGSAKAGWIPHDTDGCPRWLPRQQRALIGLLVALAHDTGHDLAARARALARLATIPAVTRDDLLPWTTASDVQLAEAALGAMATLDHAAQALPVLLDHLDGDRARVAMYAIPRVARRVQARELQAALEELLGREHLKVTVHKEAIRLLGLHRLPASARLLQEQWSRPLHRDVRIALLHAVWSFLDEPWSWALLDQAARDPDPELALVLTAVVPWSVPAVHHPRLLGVLARLAHHPEPRARRAFYGHLARDTGGLARADLALALATAAQGLDDDPSVAPSAATALVVLGSLGAHDVVLDALLALRDRVGSEPVVPAEGELDRPQLRLLGAVLATLTSRTLLSRPRYRPLGEAVVRALADHGPSYRPRAALLLALHPGTDGSLDALIDQAPHPLDLAALGNDIVQTIADRRRPWTIQTVLDLCDHLVPHGDEGAALLRLALIEGAGERHGWGPALRQRLAALRRHPVVGRLALAVEL